MAKLKKCNYNQLQRLKVSPGTPVVVLDRNNAIYVKQEDGSFRSDFSDPVEITMANLGSVQSGAKVVITDYNKLAESDSRGYRHNVNLYVEYPSRISQAMRDVLYGAVSKKAISFIGHSIVYGQNTGASESDYKTTSLPARIAARLNAYLGTALDTGAIFLCITTAVFMDARWRCNIQNRHRWEQLQQHTVADI